MDTAYCLQKTLDKILEVTERDKKRNYLDSCMQQRCHFPPFVFYFDGVLGTEIEAIMKRLDIRLTTLWRKTYYQTCGYVWGRVAIIMVRATQHCTWG